jgi:hypothetical protein
MSEYTVIRAVSLTLYQLLKEHFTLEPQLKNVQIDLGSPKELGKAGETKRISLWLYRVTRNEHTLNQPPRRTVANQIVPHPLPLNLYYLVTPITNQPPDEQDMLGAVLQVFHDHAILRSSDVPHLPQLVTDNLREELRLTLETLSLEEITRVWNALQASYQLSVSYLVQVVTIDSDHEPVQVSPVVVKETTYTQILSST